VRREDDGDVAVLRLEHGKVAALDLELLEGLGAALDELARERPAAVVLTGTGSSFSAGVDLHRVLEGGRAYIEPFLRGLERAFRALFTFPRPIVAALNGHAIAGGLVLACACDRRLLARGNARLGVPELAVGVAFPALALEIVRGVLPARAMGDLLLRGHRVDGEAALALGLVDELVDADRLRARRRRRRARAGCARRTRLRAHQGRLARAGARSPRAHGRRPRRPRARAVVRALDPGRHRRLPAAHARRPLSAIRAQG
jgi:enoyl-CoA hydratase